MYLYAPWQWLAFVNGECVRLGTITTFSASNDIEGTQIMEYVALLGYIFCFLDKLCKGDLDFFMTKVAYSNFSVL